MKRLLSVILALLIASTSFLLCRPAKAFGADTHDDYLEKVLLVTEPVNDQTKSIELLEIASYYTIDEFNGAKRTEYIELRLKLRNIPKFDEIDFNANQYTHRQFTHHGWDYDYEAELKEDKAHWEERKQILKKAVNYVFDFGFFNELFGKTCEQAESFCALVYYVHILGDHIQVSEDANDKEREYLIPFADKYSNEESPDVFIELKKHSEILFESQKKSNNYKNFIDQLDTLHTSACYISDNDSEKLLDKETELMELLEEYIPDLLKNESFFKKEFYGKK